MQRAERGEELTIGFFGGSITQGKILKPLTNLVSSFAMGTTVLLGQQIGCGERKKGRSDGGNCHCDVRSDRADHDCDPCDFCASGQQYHECAGRSL